MSDLSITAANVAPSVGAINNRKSAIAAVAITQGQVLYKLTATDSTYGYPQVGLADSNAVAPANSVEGIAINAAQPGQIVDYIPLDSNFGSGATGVAVGSVAYLSNTAGGITVTYSEVASSSTVISLGVFITGTNFNFSPTSSSPGVKP